MSKELIESYNGKKKEIAEHLKKFDNLGEEAILREHLFCILTPQSNAKLCWQAIEILTSQEIKSSQKIAQVLRGRARFHNTKAQRFLKAKKNWPQTRKMLNENTDATELRNKIAESTDGYGLKEAGHFLRNIGKSQNKIAILDRHIVRNLQKFGALPEEDIKLGSKKDYLTAEKKALEFAQKVNIPIDHLDLLFWHNEHGEFFK